MSNRFRPAYRELQPSEKDLLDALKSKAEELEIIYDAIKMGAPGRYKSLAFTALEESVMWAVKEITA